MTPEEIKRAADPRSAYEKMLDTAKSPSDLANLLRSEELPAPDFAHEPFGTVLPDELVAKMAAARDKK